MYAPFNNYGIDFQPDELSHSFEYQFGSAEAHVFEENDEANETISYTSPARSPTSTATGNMTQFMKSFIASILTLKITESDTTLILKQCANLVENLKVFNSSLIADNVDMHPVEVLEMCSRFVRNSIFAVNSKYKRNKEARSRKSYVASKEYAIGTRWELQKKKVNGRIIQIPRLIQSEFIYISILKSLEVLFSYQHVADQYFKYNLDLQQNHICESDKFINFCCGSAFKSIELFKIQPFALQLQIAYDDFEPCNPLASKSNRHKICAVYMSVQNMPVNHLSKCRNIFLVALCNSDDINMKHTDFNNIWHPIVNELKQLEAAGIEIINRPRLKGTLTQLAFDNLGANTALGFVKSFNAKSYCRICECSKIECQQLIEENTEKIRTLESYKIQIDIVSESTKVDYSETKGVKYYCLLSDLNYFHVVSNPTVDIMHDINEGCIPTVLRALLKQCLEVKLNLNDLNMMVQFFDYGVLERRNKPSQIDLEKNNLGQNASQSLCLFRFIPFILWNYRDNPELKNNWECIGALLRIVEIVYSMGLTENDLMELTKQVKVMSSRYIQTGRKLIPKMHFILHYPRIIRAMGSILQLNMFRYERKHQIMKQFTTRNFSNINKTLTDQHQKLLSLNGFSYEDEINVGHSMKFKGRREFENQLNIISDSENVVINEIKWLKINNYEYRKDLFVIHRSCFYQIQHVLECRGKYFILCWPYENVSFQLFLNSFEVEKNQSGEHTLISVEELNFLKTFEAKNHKSVMYIIADSLDMRMIKRYK